MLWFKESYKSRVRSLAESALAFDLMSTLGLSVDRPDIGRYAYNELEGVAAKIWCLDRALRSLPSRTQFHRAQDVLRERFIDALRPSHSHSEIRSLVLPVFERRHQEYERIFESGGTPSESITSVLSAMIGNFVEFEEVKPVHQVAAMPYLGNALLLQPTKEVKAMCSGENSVRW